MNLLKKIDSLNNSISFHLFAFNGILTFIISCSVGTSGNGMAIFSHLYGFVLLLLICLFFAFGYMKPQQIIKLKTNFL